MLPSSVQDLSTEDGNIVTEIQKYVFIKKKNEFFEAGCFCLITFY